MIEMLIIAAMSTSPIPSGQQEGDYTQRKYVCQANGLFFEEGERACLAVPGASRTAICGTVLNNSAWRFVDEPCAPQQPSTTAEPDKDTPSSN
ncbi:hypothetical protein [Aliihoeflea sp. PC F10.4]